METDEFNEGVALLDTEIRKLESDERAEHLSKDVTGFDVEPIRIKLRKPVLYKEEADEAIRANVHDLWTQDYQSRPTVMRIVQYRDAYYWMRKCYYLTCLVHIGMDGEILVMKNWVAERYLKEVGKGWIEVPIKDCSSQTKENTTLVAQLEYNPKNNHHLGSAALLLKGQDIRNFPHSYWNVRTLVISDPEDSGCCGQTTFIDEKKMHNGEIVRIDRVSLWNGKKLLRNITASASDYTIEQMLDYWKGFWKACGA